MGSEAYCYFSSREVQLLQNLSQTEPLGSANLEGLFSAAQSRVYIQNTELRRSEKRRGTGTYLGWGDWKLRVWAEVCMGPGSVIREKWTDTPSSLSLNLSSICETGGPLPFPHHPLSPLRRKAHHSLGFPLCHSWYVTECPFDVPHPSLGGAALWPCPHGTHPLPHAELGRTCSRVSVPH